MASDDTVFEELELNEQMGLSPDVPVPDAVELRRAELQFMVTREEGVKELYDKMKAGEDLFANEALKSMGTKLIILAYRGYSEMEVIWQYVDTPPSSYSSSNTRMSKNFKSSLSKGTLVKYADGSMLYLDNYLKCMTYMHALCEFIYDSFEDKGYQINLDSHEHRIRKRNSGTSSSEPETALDPTSVRKEKIREFFIGPRGVDSFNFYIRWGDSDFDKAVRNIELMSQYNAYTSGVPLADIFA